MIPFSRNTFLAGAFLLSSIAMAQTTKPNAVLEIEKIDAQGIAKGWSVDAHPDPAVIRFAPADDKITFSRIILNIPASAAKGGRQVQSPNIPVLPGQSIKLTHRWRGANLFDVTENGQRKVADGKIEILYLDAEGKFISNTPLYRFAPVSEFTAATLESTVPDKAVNARLRLEVALTERGTPGEVLFEVGNFKLEIE